MSLLLKAAVAAALTALSAAGGVAGQDAAAGGGGEAAAGGEAAGGGGGAATATNPSWVLPLAPAAYGGPGVINPYSNVNPLNPMAAQMQQQAAGLQGNVPQTLMGPAYTARAPAMVELGAAEGDDAERAADPEAREDLDDAEIHRLLQLEDRAYDDYLVFHARQRPQPVGLDFLELAAQHRAMDRLRKEEQAASNLVVPGAAAPNERQTGQGACGNCVYVGDSPAKAAEVHAASRASCGQCPAQPAHPAATCSCATQEVRTTVLKPNGTAQVFLEEAQACGCHACPCEQQFVTPTVTECGCSTCPCDAGKFVKPELKTDYGTHIGQCQCRPDDEDCKCRLRQQRITEAREAAASKYMQPEYLPVPTNCAPGTGCHGKIVTVEPDRPACQEGCKRHAETGQCQCNTVVPEIKDDCPCHAEPECGCRRPVTQVVRTTTMNPNKNATAPAAPAAQKK